MAILTKSGRAAIAQVIASHQIFLAWGSGDAAWDAARVSESTDATALVSEVGRRLATSVQYVNPDVNGDIVVPVFNGGGAAQAFSVSATPTNNIYMRFNFDYTDAPTATIRELAVFLDSKPIDGLPAGQRYFTPAQISDPGKLLAIENLLEKVIRSASSRQAFEFVFTV